LAEKRLSQKQPGTIVGNQHRQSKGDHIAAAGKQKWPICFIGIDITVYKRLPIITMLISYRRPANGRRKT